MSSPQPFPKPKNLHTSALVDRTRHESPTETDNVSSATTSRETQTAYQPSTGTDPSGRMEYEQRKKEVKREMTGHWVEGDNDLLDSFFPPGSVSQDDIQHVKRELYDSKRKRWRGIPKTLTDERVLVSALLKILRTICRHGKIGSDYDILDTQKACISTHDGSTLAPDVFFSLLHALISPAEVHETTPSSFEQCLAFLEAKLHNNRSAQKDAIQLATYAREILMAQSNRRFVPAFSMTERIMQFSMFDRSGALRSSHFDYHKHPDRFCEIFLSLLQRKPESFGFDRTVFYKTPSVQCIRTTERSGTNEQKDVTYIVEGLLMRSYTIVGSGTTYWRGRKEGDSRSSEPYIIRDAWRTPDMEDEQALIRDAGNNVYVAPLVHTEVVPSHAGGPDTTVHNRLTPQAARNTVDRIHTRTIYRSSGRLLENFEDPMEVLIALHHAIKGHGALRAQGILQQDILPWNILIPPRSQNGNSGSLIDLDRAVRTQSPRNIRRDFTPGSWYFLPRTILAGGTVTTHIDDLEAFFHIFCFIVVGHTGPSLARSRIKSSAALVGYGSTSDIALNAKKYLVESETFNFTVQTGYFKEPTAQLAKDLHSFFHAKWRMERDMKKAGQLLPLHDIVGDYKEVTGHIVHAVNQLAMMRGYISPLGSAGQHSEVEDPSVFTGAQVAEVGPSTVERIGRKRTLSMAFGQKRRTSPRKNNCARVSYSDSLF